MDDLKLVDFSDTERGVKTLRRFEEREKIVTIPYSVLWTTKYAYTNLMLGPVLFSARLPLSIDDILATYILFI